MRYMKKVRTRGPCGAHTAVFWSWCTCRHKGAGTEA